MPSLKYKFKRKPRPHQVRAIQAALKQMKKTGGFALLMEPRTGKTQVAIDLASILHQAGRVNRVLVLCPISVIGVWEDEIRAVCGQRRRVTTWDRKGRKRYDLPPYGQNVMDWVLMNPDAFSTPGRHIVKNGKRTGRRSRTRGGKWDIRRSLKAWAPDLVIVDESHRFKSPTAAKTKILWSLNRSVNETINNIPYRLILTGTVQTKKKRAVDVYSQVKFMNPDSPLVAGMNSTDFKQEYSVFTERNGYPQWLRARNSEKMRRLLHREAFACTRLEAYGDTSQRLDNQIIPVELTGENERIYAEMAEEMIAKIKSGEITEASIRLVQALRLGQITSGFAKTTPTAQHPEAKLMRVGDDKLRVFTELTSDLFEADEKIVVGARWRADIAAIVEVCRKLKVPSFELHGGIKDRRERDRQRIEFNRRSGPACFIMQPAAGSLGIDLGTTSIFIWYSLTNSWVDFTQAEDRIALFPGPRIYMYLLARGTVDYLMYQSLLEDEEIGKLVMKAPEQLWVPDA